MDVDPMDDRTWTRAVWKLFLQGQDGLRRRLGGSAVPDLACQTSAWAGSRPC